MQFGNPLNGIVTITQTQFSVYVNQALGAGGNGLALTGGSIVYPAGTTIGNYHSCIVILRCTGVPTGGNVMVQLEDSNGNNMWGQSVPASAFALPSFYTVTIPLPLTFGTLGGTAVSVQIQNTLTGLGVGQPFATIVLDQTPITPAVLLGGVAAGMANVPVAIENTPIEVAGGSSVSQSVYEVSGGLAATANLAATGNTVLVAAPGAGKCLRLKWAMLSSAPGLGALTNYVLLEDTTSSVSFAGVGANEGFTVNGSYVIMCPLNGLTLPANHGITFAYNAPAGAGAQTAAIFYDVIAAPTIT